MQENRSFDHYFGVMRGVRGFGDPHPVTLPSGQPVWYQADGATVVPPFRPDVGNLALTFIEDLDHSWDGTHQMFNGGNWDQWLPAKTTTCMAHMERVRPSVSLRAGRRLHGLRWLPLLDARSDRPQPLLHVDRLGWQRRQGRRAGDRQRRARVRVADLSGAAPGGRGQLEDLPGPRRRSRRGPLLGLGIETRTSATTATTRCCTSSTIRTRRRAARCTRGLAPGPTSTPAAASSTSSPPTCKSGRLPSVSWIVAPEAYTEHPAWPAGYGAWYTAGVLNALTATPRCGQRPRC